MTATLKKIDTRPLAKQNRWRDNGIKKCADAQQEPPHIFFVSNNACCQATNFCCDVTKSNSDVTKSNSDVTKSNSEETKTNRDKTGLPT